MLLERDFYTLRKLAFYPSWVLPIFSQAAVCHLILAIFCGYINFYLVKIYNFFPIYVRGSVSYLQSLLPSPKIML